jgi:O-antigen/teichoic acid export membrane protein
VTTQAASAARAGAGSDARSLARGGLVNLLASGGGQVFTFLMTVVVTRGLGARDAGAFFEVIGLFTILSNSVRLGADTGMVRTLSASRALGALHELGPLVRAALWPVLLAGIGAGAATWTLAPLLTRVFLHGSASSAGVTGIRLLSFFLPMVAVTIVALSGTRGFGTMLPYAVIENLGKPFLRLLLVAAVVMAGLGSVAVLLAWAAPVAAGFVAALWVLFHLVRRTEAQATTPRPAGASREILARFWRFAAPRGLAGIFQITVIWLDVLLVGALRSTSEAGVYAAASRLAMVGGLVTEAVRIAIAPQISWLLARREHARVEGVYQVGTWWIMALCWPLYLTLAIFGPVVLRIFGSEFVAGGSALLILSLGMLFSLATGNVTVMLLMGGKSSWNLLNAAGAVVVNVGLNLLLVPRIGITGAALAWAASMLLENTAALIQLRILMRLNPLGPGWWVAAGQSVLCYAGIGLLFWRFAGHTLPSLVVFAALATGLYVWLLWRARGVLQLDVLREAIRARRRGATVTDDAQEATSG